MSDNISSVPQISSLSFEQAMQELESIVRRLEDGKVALEDAIKLFERGNTLRAHCEEKLKQAQTRVEKIVDNKNGEVTTTPFDLGA